MIILDDIPHTPYFIFIKGAQNISDSEVFNLLGIHNTSSQAFSDESSDNGCLFLHRSNDWVHIMDNWFYDLWFSDEFNLKLNELGKSYDLFACWVGECDESFGFKYFNEGKLVRDYVVESPNYSDQVVTLDFGEALIGEADAFELDDQTDLVLHIASQLGIVPASNPAEVNCYRWITKELKPQENQIKKRSITKSSEMRRPFFLNKKRF